MQSIRGHFQGVTMFYFTVFNMDNSSRLVLDEYERLGLAETTVIQTEYDQLDWQFHLIQVHVRESQTM